MPLEGILDEEDLKDIKGKPFAINPKSKYDRKEFVYRAGELFDLMEYHGKLSQNSGDVGALKDLVGLASSYIEGDEQYKQDWVTRAMENPHVAIARGDAMAGTGEFAMAKYVEKNRKKVLDEIPAERLLQIIFDPQTSLYETGDEKHDRITKVINKLKRIDQAQDAAAKGNESALSMLDELVKKELNDLFNSMPDEHKLYINQDSAYAIPQLKAVVTRTIQRKLGKLFRDDKGNLNKGAIVDYLERNYQAVEDDIDDVPEGEKFEKERFKRWDKNLKPHYMALAQALHEQEKPKQEDEEDSEKSGRKITSKKKGIRT